MRYIIFIGTIIFSISCKNSMIENKKIVFNDSLYSELSTMVDLDQLVASNERPPDEFKNLSQEQWEAKKEEIWRLHKIRLQEILNEFGFPGFDLVGPKGSLYFWVMVQHSDFDPQFQSTVLEKMKVQVEAGNAHSGNYALLIDRIKINTGEKQIYGSQVNYIEESGKAIPKPLEDSMTVDERRISVGLPPINEYLNGMTKSYFEKNKKELISKGILEPQLH